MESFNAQIRKGIQGYQVSNTGDNIDHTSYERIPTNVLPCFKINSDIHVHYRYQEDSMASRLGFTLIPAPNVLAVLEYLGYPVTI